MLRGNRGVGATVIIIGIAIIIGAFLALGGTANNVDDETVSKGQALTNEFVNDISNTGKLTQDKYDKYVESCSSLGIAPEVEITIQYASENAAKKSTTSGKPTIGDGGGYMTEYTTQTMEKLATNLNNEIKLDAGDIVSVELKSLNSDWTSKVNPFAKNSKGKTIASASGMVTMTTKTK